MLKISSLTVSYDAHTVLKDLDLGLSEGNIHGLVGLNGSGKTTLLNSIYGLKKEDKGTITWQSENVRRSHVAYLETQNYFYPRINGIEYLRLFKANNRNFDIKGWNTLFKLPLNDLIESYSTGMKKKLALLGIVSLNRPFIILDEPYNGLDLEASLHLKNLLLKLKEAGKTVLITSHILESLTNCCDQIHYLCEGTIEKSFGRSEYSEIEHIIYHKHEAESRQLLGDLVKKL